MHRLALLVFLASPAFSASPADRLLDFVDVHVSREVQVEYYKAYGDLHETLRKSVRRAGKLIRRESRRMEDSLLDWSKDHEKRLRRTIRDWDRRRSQESPRG